VEFYWCNPSLGINRFNANLVGAAWVDLANRFTLYPDWVEVDRPYGRYISRGCHAIVRCPESWVPSFVNEGHECLVIRAFEPIMDAVGREQFSPAADRHVAQRNIAVVQAASPAEIDLALDLGYPEAPAHVEVDVEIDTPSSMEWLKLFTGSNNPGLVPVNGEIVSGLLPPVAAGRNLPKLKETDFDARKPHLSPQEHFHRGCDRLQVGFHASVQDIAAGQAQVMRIRQRIDGNAIGGYSVVLIRE
jgi:hypothetical protein